MFSQSNIISYLLPLCFLGWACSSENKQKDIELLSSKTSNDSVTSETFITDTLVSYADSVPSTIVLEGDSNLSRTKKGITLYKHQPYSGHILKYFTNNQVNTDKGYFDGFQEGNALSYYEDGQKRYIRPFVHGKKHGTHTGWHTNGVMKYQYFFAAGKSEGNHKTWHASGLIFQDQNYKDGHEFGSQKVYRPDGKIRSNYVIRENGKKYGLAGLKRCDPVETDKERIKW